MKLTLSDLKIAVRGLSRNPLFSFVVICTLAVGIGANTAIFTLIDQLILRRLPVQDPQRLVMIWPTGPAMGVNRGLRALSYPIYQDFQKEASPFSFVFCRFLTQLSITIEGHTERVDAELVSGNYFQSLGVLPAVGRVFSPEQDDRFYKGHPAIVLSHQYWTSRFGSDKEIVGKKILVNGYPMEIVGVSAAGFPGFDPSRSPQIRVPIQMKPLMTPGWDDLGNRRSQWIQMFGRLKPGYTMESAQASLQTLFTRILQNELQQPELKDISPTQRQRFLQRKIEMEVASTGYSEFRRSYSSALIVLMGMVGAVLLIVCFNVANLLMARGLVRQKEVVVRLALGASRAQIIGPLLVESLLLSCASGLIGMLLSVLITRVLLNSVSLEETPLLLRAWPDGRVLAFNLAVSLFTGILFGLAPAWQSLRLNQWKALRDASGTVAGDSGSALLRKALVIAQVAVSFFLVVGAGLFAKSLANLRNTKAGFSEMQKLVTFQVDPALNSYDIPRVKTFYQDLLAKIHTLPEVKSSGYAMVPLLSGDHWGSSITAAGYQVKEGEDLQTFVNAVSPGFISTMGLPLLQGRDFDERDQGQKLTVAIVNRTFARHFFGDASPIGRRIGFGRGASTMKYEIEIIGMVEDSLTEGPRESVHRQIFVPFSQIQLPASVAFYVRTSNDPGSVFAEIRNKISELDSGVPVFAMKTLEGQLTQTLGTERLIAALSVAFGVFATVLAATGLYAVIAFVVTRRTKEIGLRIAMGAQRERILGMIMKEALLLVAIGLAVGIPSAYFLSRYVSSQLFEVAPADAGSAVLALIVLSLVAAGAGLVPALRASRIDPVIALKYE